MRSEPGWGALVSFLALTRPGRRAWVVGPGGIRRKQNPEIQMNSTPGPVPDTERLHRVPELVDQKNQAILGHADKITTLSASAIAVIAAFIDGDAIGRRWIIGGSATCFCIAVVLGAMTNLAELQAANKVLGQILDPRNIQHYKPAIPAL